MTHDLRGLFSNPSHLQWEDQEVHHSPGEGGEAEERGSWRARSWHRDPHRRQVRQDCLRPPGQCPPPSSSESLAVKLAEGLQGKKALTWWAPWEKGRREATACASARQRGRAPGQSDG